MGPYPSLHPFCCLRPVSGLRGDEIELRQLTGYEGYDSIIECPLVGPPPALLEDPSSADLTPCQVSCCPQGNGGTAASSATPSKVSEKTSRAGMQSEQVGGVFLRGPGWEVVVWPLVSGRQIWEWAGVGKGTGKGRRWWQTCLDLVPVSWRGYGARSHPWALGALAEAAAGRLLPVSLGLCSCVHWSQMKGGAWGTHGHMKAVPVAACAWPMALFRYIGKWFPSSGCGDLPTCPSLCFASSLQEVPKCDY